MPPYELIHIENVLWVLGGGTLFVVAIVLARYSTKFTWTLRRRSDDELDAETHEFGGGVTEQQRPVPLFIWLVALGYFAWAIGYVVFSGARGL